MLCIIILQSSIKLDSKVVKSDSDRGKYMSIKQGLFLKELRVKNNLSQEKLGEELGLSRQSISKWETGYAMPDTENLLKLSKLYGISVDAILNCEQEKVDEEKTEESKEIINTGILDDEPLEIIVNNDDLIPNQNDEDNDEIIVLKYQENNKEKKAKHSIFFWSFPFLMFIAYFLIGYFFGEIGWARGWIILLTIPIYYSSVYAVQKKNPLIFCYPFVTLIAFLFLGFFYSLWHPSWIIFLTIPIYYIFAYKKYKNK